MSNTLEANWILNVLTVLEDYSFSEQELHSLFFLLQQKLTIDYFDFEISRPNTILDWRFRWCQELHKLIENLGNQRLLDVKIIHNVGYYQIGTSEFNQKFKDCIADFLDEERRTLIKECAEFVK